MAKIGILTYHRSHNYGALLQAVALQKVLSGMGHEVYYVDYFPKYHQKMYALFDKDKFVSLSCRNKAKYLKHFVSTFGFRKKRYNVFRSFIKKYIEPFCKPLSERFDYVVYGSDQIWRKQPIINAYNPMYFGKNELQTAKHVSYAASMVDLPSDEEDKQCFLELVSHLDKISVREESVRKFLEDNGYKDVSLGLDPTLLLTKGDWDTIIPDERLLSEKYILLFDIHADTIHSSFSMNEVMRFANQYQYKVVRLWGKAFSSASKFDRSCDGPSEFVNLVRHSEMVLTSSYHGLVFSLLMGKPVYGCFPYNKGRASSLLSALGLSERLLLPNSKLILEKEIDYSQVSQMIGQMRVSSFEYLNEMVL